MKPETNFRQNKVLPFLKSLPNTWFESIQQLAIHGTPDTIACIKGKFVALEFKSEDGEADPLQRHKLDKIQRAGGVGYVVSPQNWGIVRLELSRLAKAKF